MQPVEGTSLISRADPIHQQVYNYIHQAITAWRRTCRRPLRMSQNRSLLKAWETCTPETRGSGEKF